VDKPLELIGVATPKMPPAIIIFLMAITHLMIKTILIQALNYLIQRII